MKKRLKNWAFALLGKEPEAVVAILGKGPHVELMRELVKGYRQIQIESRAGEPAGEAWMRLRRDLAPYRVAQVAVRMEDEALFRAALLAFPGKVLAFNRNMERHHIRLAAPISSTLFLAGVPLDRIHLRPSWLFPFKKDISNLPRKWNVRQGRPWREGFPRVALLSPYFPWPLSHGGAVRIYNLLREAAKEFDIALFSFHDGQKELDFVRIQALCPMVYVASTPRYREPRWATLLPPEACEFYTPELEREMREEMRANGISLLQTEYTMLARYGGDILTEHDVTFDLFEQSHARERSLKSWWDLVRWRRFEKRALRRYKQVVVMSGKDAELLKQRPTVVIPNGVDLERFAPEPESPGQNLLFVGSFRHFPNVLAWRFFSEQVWPLIEKERPDVRVTVVAGPNPHLYWPQPSPDPRIELRGFTADVRPLYAAANVVLIPTTVSAGTNLKALEAMATKRAIVSTPSGVAGLGLEHGKSVWIGVTAEEFAAGVGRLLDDAQKRREMAECAHELAVERYGWPALAKLQTDLWRAVSRHE